MAVQGALWLAKRYPSTLISVFLTGFLYFSYQAATQLASRGWVDPIPDPILLEKFLGSSRESNPGPLGFEIHKKNLAMKVFGFEQTYMYEILVTGPL